MFALRFGRLQLFLFRGLGVLHGIPFLRDLGEAPFLGLPFGLGGGQLALRGPVPRQFLIALAPFGLLQPLDLGLDFLLIDRHGLHHLGPLGLARRGRCEVQAHDEEPDREHVDANGQHQRSKRAEPVDAHRGAISIPRIGNLGRYGHETDALDAGALQERHELQDACVGDAAVAVDQDRDAGSVAQHRTDARHERLGGDRRIPVLTEIHVETTLGVHGYDERLHIARRHRLRGDLREVHLDPLGDERCRDHEDDEQDQHHIDVRYDVDVRDQPLASVPPRPDGAAVGHQLWACRCKME